MTAEEFFDWYKEKEEADFQIEEKDAYERTWACRDFELSHLWQRSVFLAVFLLAIAGAYGTLLMKMYFPDEQKIKTVWQQHAIAAGVCWLGIMFSILWVMMAKGSKYWVERYEKGINKFEREIAGEKLKDLPHHGEMPALERYQYDENIFSTKTGHYSVSRVNTAIGIISLLSFSVLEIFHFGKFLDRTFDSLTNLQLALFTFSFYLGTGAVLFAFLKYLCQSNYNYEKESGE